MITKQQKEQVWTLHETQGMSKKEIALKMRISRPSVIKILNEPQWKNCHLVDTVKEIEKKSTDSLIKLIENDSRLPDTINKILNAVNKDEVIDSMIHKGDLKQLMTVFGVLSDKHFSSKRIKQDEKRIAIQERMAELKERELEMRVTSPESFHTVQIINDAPSEIVKDNQYGTN